MADATERSFIMIKPDGVQRGLVGEIIRRFETRGYKLVALKMIQVSFKKIFYSKNTFFYLNRHQKLYLKIIMKNTRVREKQVVIFLLIKSFRQEIL